MSYFLKNYFTFKTFNFNIFYPIYLFIYPKNFTLFFYQYENKITTLDVNENILLFTYQKKWKKYNINRLCFILIPKFCNLNPLNVLQRMCTCLHISCIKQVGQAFVCVRYRPPNKSLRRETKTYTHVLTWFLAKFVLHRRDAEKMDLLSR